MTALAKERARSQFPWSYKSFTLVSGTKAWKGGAAVLGSDGKVRPASSTTGLLAIGIFAETVDATAGDLPVQIDLQREVKLEWFVNATAGDAVAATDIGSTCYFLDDQTVTITAAGRSPAGRVWAVDAIKGVGVEKLDTPRRVLSMPAVGTYAPASIEQDAIYDVPATGAASTITLPAAAPDGTRASFAADGTKNGHTVQYRDATGPTNLTTALTASKRHLVIVEKLGGKWFANAYVSP